VIGVAWATQRFLVPRCIEGEATLRISGAANLRIPPEPATAMPTAGIGKTLPLIQPAWIQPLGGGGGLGMMRCGLCAWFSPVGSRFRQFWFNG